MKLPRPRWPDITPPPDGAPRAPLRVRIAWMIALWVGSVLVLFTIASVLRAVLIH
jgi:hypothetical protein